MSTEAFYECRRLIYHGRVQGVGFRYTTLGIARRHQVSGFVRNLPDGSVELLVQGPAEHVASFLQDLAGTFSGNIKHVDQTDESVQAELSGFTIRR